ncbi:pesticin C-terminus-like muramidase [Luteibacter sp.]|uniref:pesticin C-terminus-like muramidase n=1 Tax=Luteibacter sp. TaxID=1886636 RepID=UPI003F7EFC28
MEVRRLSVVVAYALSGYQLGASAAPAPHDVTFGSAPSRSDPKSGLARAPGHNIEQTSSAMRPLTVEEIELIMGTNSFTTPMTGTTVTATIFPTEPPVTVTPTGGGGGDGGGGTGTGGDGNGGSGGDGGSGGGGGGSGSIGSQGQHCYIPLAAVDRIDPQHVWANEDGVHGTGYLIPGAPNAGVTIGAGVDLGQQSVAGLQAMGIGQAIIDIVSPYLGLKGSAAAAKVASAGEPVLGNASAISLSLGLLNSTEHIVATQYNAATTGIQFEQLPADAQTVIVDVAYPNGPYLSASAPGFWSSVTTGNWSAAVSELQNWYGPNNTNNRYLGDASMIQSAIATSNLPSDSSEGHCH